MLLRLERHYKAEQAARQAAEAQLAELAALRGSHMNEVESQKASVKQVGGCATCVYGDVAGGSTLQGRAVLRCVWAAGGHSGQPASATCAGVFA